MTPPPAGDRRTAWLLFAGAFLLYARTITFDYALDDRAVTFENRFVRQGMAGIPEILSTFYWAGFWDANAGLFRPLSLLLFAMEWQLFPDAPRLYHLVQVLLYALTAMLLYRVLRRLIPDRASLIPLVAAVIWIVHPTHTEVVANVKSADEILAVLFALLSLRSFLLGRFVAGGALFFCALLSKEAALTLAAVILLALFLFHRRGVWRAAAALGVATLAWAAWHQAVIRAAPLPPITYRYVDNSLVAAPDLSSRIATALQMQGRYLLKTIVGYPLSYDHSFREIPNLSFKHPTVWISALLLAGLLVLAFAQRQRQPILTFGIATWFLALAMTSNLFVLIGATMADRFLFAPTIGWALCLAVVLTGLLRREELIILTGAIVLVHSMQTMVRSADWRSDETLFPADVANAPNSGRVRRNYGTLLMNRAFATPRGPARAKLLDVSLRQLDRAAEIDTLDYDARFALGQVEYNRGNYAASAQWSAAAIDTWRRAGGTPPASAHMNLGDARMMLGNYAPALDDFLAAAQLEPTNGQMAMKVGNARYALGGLASAASAYETSVRLDPTSVEAWDKLANTHGMLGNDDRSREAFAEAARLRAGGPSAVIVDPIMEMRRKIRGAPQGAPTMQREKPSDMRP